MKKIPASPSLRKDIHASAIVELIEQLSRRYDRWRVWSDFVEISAIALAKLDRTKVDKREARYLEVVRRYTRDEVNKFAQAFAHLFLAFKARFKVIEYPTSIPLIVDFADILGQLYMALNLGNSHRGQFFTPYEVSKLCTGLSLANAPLMVGHQGYIRILEPACGAGGMIIAAADILAAQGVNYQRSMHVTAIDIDLTCVHMTFVQCVPLHIPAVVAHGNGLTGETWDQWFTPTHILGGWSLRLKRNHVRSTVSSNTGHPPAAPDHASSRFAA
ncbi:N-6 DNA methylase [Achromobacter aloeverae]